MQKRNYYTELDDFLTDLSFQKWVLLKEDDQCWEEWTLETLDRARLVDEARLFLLAMKVSNTAFTAADIREGLIATWIKIGEKENRHSSTNSFKTIFSKNHWLTKVAAIFIIGFLSVWIYNFQFSERTKNKLTYNDLIEENSEGLVEQTNNSNKPQNIILSDGSSVLLQPNSKLSYPKNFIGNERKVYLSGEAFFEISKNPKKPFYVYANEIVTKVVGTSFRVKAYPDKPNVEVLVRTGKVMVKSNESVAIPHQKQEAILLPNQALRFFRKELRFNKITDISQDVILSHSAGNIEQLSFEFTDIPVAQIFKTIEQAYAVKIDFPSDKLKNCHLTTSLSDQPLTEKLKIICESLGNATSFEMNGNQIIVISKGCE